MDDQLQLGVTAGQLWFGDNLEVLRRHVGDESVDLVYLDPPFNSNREHNVLFQHRDGRKAAAQLRTFADTWRWDRAAASTFHEVVEDGGDVAKALLAFRDLIGTTDMLAYLTMMAPRLVELHRTLKPTGSLYLHCDPTASHYLKLLLDAVFGPTNYRNEIVWKRTSAHSDSKQGRQAYGAIHDVVLYYAKSPAARWNPYFTAYDATYAENEYRHVTPDGRRYKEADVTAAKPGGDTEYLWRIKRQPAARWEADLDDEYLQPVAGWEYGAVGPYRNRYWAYSKQNLKEFVRSGCLVHRSTGQPRLMLFLDEMPGIGPQDLWTDIPPISAGAAERLGYPTQKPLALLERIVASSSNPGDVVLDPFCGCGTAVDAAQKLGRQWIGIDVTKVAIEVILGRLHEQHGELVYHLGGEPTTVEDAEALAELDKHEFQHWVCRQVGVKEQKKKGADRGIDGQFVGIFDNGDSWKGILSVKGGGTSVAHVRDLRGTVERDKADFGVLVCLQPPTKAMRRDAADAGFTPEGVPRMQIVTVADLLDGNGPVTPRATARQSNEANAPRRRLRAV